MTRRLRSYREFWPFYLGEHSRAGTRRWHFLGIALGLLLLAVAGAAGDWRPLAVAPAAGYACAWIGHAFVERNTPATFRHPLWSFLSDFRMFGLWITGRLELELTRLGIGEASAGKR